MMRAETILANIIVLLGAIVSPLKIQSPKSKCNIISAISFSALGESSLTSSGTRSSWMAADTTVPFEERGFGKRTSFRGQGDKYIGNVGNPYGSNIIEVSATNASRYKYVVRFLGSQHATLSVIIWNKAGPTGLIDGHYIKPSRNFSLNPGTTKYFAFDEDSQGGWSATEGFAFPKNSVGSYAETWGEFDFGSSVNKNWSGFDVSAIQAQDAGKPVRGMKICDVLSTSHVCSSISSSGRFQNAYSNVTREAGGIGGNLLPNPVRLSVHLDHD